VSSIQHPIQHSTGHFGDRQYRVVSIQWPLGYHAEADLKIGVAKKLFKNFPACPEKFGLKCKIWDQKSPICKN